MADRYRFELLAPPRWHDACAFTGFSCEPGRYVTYLKQLQILRGIAYLEDAAIRRGDLDGDGRFHMPRDTQSWHLLLVETDSGAVIGCIRYFVHSNEVRFHELHISQSVLAADPTTNSRMHRIIEADIEIARRNALAYVEIGGWAVLKTWRKTRAAVDMLAASYALGELWGGCVGICTATFRNASASIIRRFSGSTSSTKDGPFTVYYDPQYDCAMELLRFDGSPARKYAPFVDAIKQKLLQAPPIVREPVQRRRQVSTHSLVA
jgi:hypothetical protein